MIAGSRRQATVALLAATAWAVAVAVAGKVGVWLAVGGAAVLLGSAVLVTSPAVRRQLRPDPSRILLGLATGLCMVAGTYVLAPLLHRFGVIEHDLRRLYAAFRVAGTGSAAIALAPVIVGEELVWRGAVQGALEHRLRPRGAAVAAAILYAAAHAPMGSLLLVVTALACGLVWSALRAVSGSLVPSLLSHLIWDAVVLLAFPIVPA
jgi:membrane protease YdiL (CAAX protease family)